MTMGKVWTAFKYLLVGAILWFVAEATANMGQEFVARSEPAPLIVLGLDTMRDHDGYTVYRPVFGLDTPARPRPQYAPEYWSRIPVQRTGDKVAGRFDPGSGEMRSTAMIGKTGWIGTIARLLGLLSVLQGIVILFGIPEILMPLRVRIGA